MNPGKEITVIKEHKGAKTIDKFTRWASGYSNAPASKLHYVKEDIIDLSFEEELKGAKNIKEMNERVGIYLGKLDEFNNFVEGVSKEYYTKLQIEGSADKYALALRGQASTSMGGLEVFNDFADTASAMKEKINEAVDHIDKNLKNKMSSDPVEASLLEGNKQGLLALRKGYEVMSNALENARKEGETRDKYKQTFKQYGIPLDPYVTYSTEELNCVGNMVAEKKKELEDADRREEARNLIATFGEVLSKLSTSKKTNQALDKYKKLDELAFYTDVTTVKSVSRDFFRENWPSVNKNTQKMLDAYYLNSLNDRKVAIKYLTDLEEYHTACANDPKADKEIRKKSGVFIKNFIQILKLKEQVMDEKLKEGP